MEYRIVELEAFKVVGYKISTTNEKQEGYKKIPKFWTKTMLFPKKRKTLLSLMDAQPMGMIGLSRYGTDTNDLRKLEYYIGVSTLENTPKGLVEYQVPKNTWAVFPCTRKTLSQTEIDVVTVWQSTAEYEVLNSGYETGYMNAKAPDLEVYGKGEEAEVWVAVKKK